MKLVFMGTPEIAVPTLDKLIHSRHKIAAVLTQPDQKSGRGMSVRFSPVKELALQYGIPILQPERLGDENVLSELESIGADLYVVAAYAKKIPDSLLEGPRYGCINMHPSLLPKYRGSGPLRGPILNGDPQSGVTIMQVTSQWDAGDILMQQAFLLDPKETAQTLEEKCASLGAQLMLKTVDLLEEDAITPIPQDASKATYLKQITKEAGVLDFSKPAIDLERQIRACIPWPSAFTALEGKTFKIWDADVTEQLPSMDLLPAGTGEIAYVDKKRFFIQTGRGYLCPLSVQLEGKKKMTTEEFLRGKKLVKGQKFGNEES